MQENNNTNKFSSEELGETTPESAGDIVSEYIVEEKDTLEDIAKRYGVSIEAIREANKETVHNTAELIRPGTRLHIPNKSST